jgi:hypothetical protein
MLTLKRAKSIKDIAKSIKIIYYLIKIPTTTRKYITIEETLKRRIAIKKPAELTIVTTEKT